MGVWMRTVAKGERRTAFYSFFFALLAFFLFFFLFVWIEETTLFTSKTMKFPLSEWIEIQMSDLANNKLKTETVFLNRMMMMGREEEKREVPRVKWKSSRACGESFLFSFLVFYLFSLLRIAKDADEYFAFCSSQTDLNFLCLLLFTSIHSASM